jgi:membrane protease YdiL (CAAX protease family)
MVKKFTPEGVTIVLGIILLFLLINFNRELGYIYGLMLIIDYIIFNDKSWLSYPIEKDERRVTDILGGVFGYAIFVIMATVSTSVFQNLAAVSTPLNAVFERLAASTPIFEKSVTLTFIGWGVLIPIVETRFFFGRLLEVFARMADVKLSLRSVKSWIVFGFISATFAIFHFSAKAVSATQFDEVALFLTFVFGMVSCALVVYSKELASAVYMHIISNSIAVSIRLGFNFIPSILGINVGGSS